MGHIDYSRLREMLAAAGWTSYTAKKTGRIGQATWKKIMQGGGLDTSTISTLCEILNCQPGDFMVYVPDEEAAQEGDEAHGS